jgi:hypothetical protein
LPGQVIILNGPMDLIEFLKRVKQPDLIIMKPGGTPGTAIPSPVSGPVTSPRAHVISAVRVRGRLAGDLAHLTIEIDLSMLAPGESWVPLGLDSQILGSAREDQRELEVRTAERGRWEVRLAGAGPHHLRVELQIPVKVSPERKSFDLGIPAAASTYLEFDLPGQVQEAGVGTGEAIGKTPLEGAKGTRLSAHLTPRSRLSLEWGDESNSLASQAPLLTAQVEIAIHADAEAITTRSSWAIRCVRGIVRRLEIRVDEQEVVRTLQLGDQFLVGGIEGKSLTIPLAEPLRPGGTRQLTVETRRPLPPGPRRTLSLAGFPLSYAVEQSGAIGITQAPDLWVSVATAKGLQRIDARDLPSKLAVRPGTRLAFRFQDPQFELGLSVEDAPALFRAATRTRLAVEEDTARGVTTVEVERIRGRLFDIEVAVPSGVELLSVGPPELVESHSTTVLKAEPTAQASADPPGQIVKVHLTPLARDQKSFSLRLGSRQHIAPSEDLRLGLLSPRAGVPGTCLVSLFTERNSTFELDKGPGPVDDASPPAFRLLPPAAPTAYGEGARERIADAVLTSDQSPSWLRGRLIRHPRAISSENSVSAQIFPDRIDLRQDTALQVRNGSIRSLKVVVPVPVGDLWEVQGKEYSRREELKPAGRDRAYLLHFDPPISDRSTLTFRYRVPLEPALVAGRECRSRIPWIRVEDTASGSTALQLTAGPGIQAAANDSAWSGAAAEWEYVAGPASATRYRLLRSGGQSERSGLPFTARLLEQAPLPSVMAPRALLRTVLGPDRESRTHAWYWIESHGAELSFRLPEGANWIRARIDGRSTDQVDKGTQEQGYRLSLAAESRSKPVLVELVYQVSAGTSGSACVPPLLQEGAVVLQTLWAIHVPGTQTLVGVPQGWTDENEWYWDLYVWKRRPWRSLTRLAAWLTGSPTQAVNVDEVLGPEQEDSHGFLFGRSGSPAPLQPTIISRAWMVAVCSGTVLLFGFYLMFSRVSFRVIWIATASVLLLGATLVQPSVLFLVVQSAVSGVILTLLGLLIQRLIGRDRSRFRPLPGMVQVPGASIDGEVEPSPVGVGSDDSTAVRVRLPSSTLDYASSPLTMASEQEPSSSSRTGPSG